MSEKNIERKHKADTEGISNNIDIQDATVGKIKITSEKILNLRIEGSRAQIGEIEYAEADFMTLARTGILRLKTSIPDGIPLQGGSTMIAASQLNVKKSLLFVPAKYRLQFIVNYSFDNIYNKVKPEIDIGEDGTIIDMKIFSNTVAHSLSIRPAIFSMVMGSVIGGLFGSFTRILKTSPVDKILVLENSIAIAITVLLSAVAVIFVARKSDTQSFVTVEDFYGGILIGFLVGYTGTSFFETLTGFNENGRIK